MSELPLDERRVLLLAPQPFYEDRGTPIAVRNVLEALSEIGYGVDVLTFPVGQNVTIPNVRYLRTRNLLGIRSVPIGLSLRKIWLDCWMFLSLRKALSRERYQLVHAVEESAFLAVVTAGRKGIPVVYDMQSSIPEHLARHGLFGTPPLQAFLRACERWLLRRVDYVACSKGLESRVKSITPALPVREWQYPSAVVAASEADESRLRSELDITSDKKVVLYTGNFEEYQGVSLLVEAIPLVQERLTDVVFVLVGADPHNGKQVRAMLSGLTPADCYRILPRQPRAEMPGFFRMTDVVVSPRAHGANFPLKVFEYLAAGCAIVMTDVPAHSSLANRKVAVMVAPDVAALAESIADLLQDETRIAALRKAARAHAESNLSWTAFLESVRDLYESVDSGE